MNQETFDVMVLGGGAGGVPAAIRAAQLGGRVAVVEEGHLGGLCMNQGCIPYGHMAAASHMLGNFSLAAVMGITCSGMKMDYARLIKRQDELIAFMRQGVQGMFKKHRVHLVKGRGSLKGPDAVEANGQVLKARKIILAAGGRWLKPDFPGADLKRVTSSDGLLTAKKLPRKCLILGNGHVAIQIAQLLQRFGCETILVTRQRYLLHTESKTIRTRVKKVLSKENIRILANTDILQVEAKKSGVACLLKTAGGEETVLVNQVVYLERAASPNGLGLEKAGLEKTASFIPVNNRMETAVKGIYAIGDLAAPAANHYSHAATHGGIVAAENAMGVDSRFDPGLVPRVSFIQPQMACIGVTKQGARESGYDVVVGSAPLSMNPFGMLIGQSEGIIEIVSEKKYGEILGVHILGEGACEMAGQAALAMQMEMTLEELAKAHFPHPTLSESLSEAAKDALGRAIYLP